ncbi:MAG: hypothetical protein HY556_03510 [Euryarchaeota archaeon]|nr:hypothetical protein [Euryarchaeota archaeon]
MIWLGVGLVLVFRDKTLRSSLGDIMRAVAAPKMLIPLLIMAGYVTLEVWVGEQSHLWQGDLAKDTFIWFFTMALVLFLDSPTFSRKPRQIRDRVKHLIGVAVVLELIMNIYVLSLLEELILQPLIFILALVSIVGQRDPKTTGARKLADILLTLIVVGLVLHTGNQLYSHWRELDSEFLFRQAALPIWLTLGLLPALYNMNLYAGYDEAFIKVDAGTDDKTARIRAKVAVMAGLHIRPRRINAFSWYWATQLAKAESYSAAREIVDRFLESEQTKEKARRDEENNLRKYAGSTAVDTEGRRLDRREFKETRNALEWIATCQAGWYRNRGGRYRPEILGLLGEDFERYGLPKDHGVATTVSEDGQAWYAWRRTMTGWCFAVGETGPPTFGWRFDGPDPPRGFPGQDSAWGSEPFATEASLNW